VKVLEWIDRFFEWRNALFARVFMAVVTVFALGSILALCVYFTLLASNPVETILGPHVAPFGGN
jgi:hypothetical protein